MRLKGQAFQPLLHNRTGIKGGGICYNESLNHKEVFVMGATKEEMVCGRKIWHRK